MANFKWNCPHCAAQTAAFTTLFISYHGVDHRHHSVARCAVCERHTLFAFKVMPLDKNFGDFLNNQNDLLSRDLTGSGNGFKSIDVDRTYPEAAVSQAPEHLPSNVTKPFIDGQDVFTIGKFENAAFSVRQALERAVKHIDPSVEGSLKAKIKQLGEKGLVTKDLVELAHTVRTEGNVAVHEEDWTKDEAHQLIEFARLFFVYVFTLPAQVKRVAAERGGPADQR